MRIGIDCRMMGGSYGGIGRYVFELARHILKADAKNQYILFYNPAFFTKEAREAFSAYKNISWSESRARHYSLTEQVSFLKLLNKSACDLVHFPNFNVPLFYKRPFVVTIHDMVHHKLRGAKKSSYLHFLAYQTVIKYAAQKARAIITVSEASKKDIVKILGVLPRKVEVVYEGNSLDTNITEGEVEEFKKRFYLTRPYFLFVGVLERKKNLVNLTRGFDRFIKKFGLDMDLVIVGRPDPHYPEIKHQAMDIENKERLVFTGQVSNPELAAAYKGAYAFVSASKYEGFGLPGLEAMSFGLPLAVSNTEVFNEIYDNAGLYFDPQSPDDIAEKMHLLASEKAFYSNLSVNALRQADFFNWDSAARKTLKIYEECLGGGL